jgi:hypothetical protein
MAANQWQFPLPGNFSLHFDHSLPIPQRPSIRDECRRAQVDEYLKEQFDLSQPGGGSDPCDKLELNSPTRSSRLPRIVYSQLQSLRKGATFASKLLLSCLFGLVYYTLKLPFDALRAFMISLDWWLVLGFFFAVALSPLTSTEWPSNKDGRVRLASDLEYELVQDFRRWGMAMINTLVF